MSRRRRILLIIAGVIVALVLIGGGVFMWFTRRSFPQTSGSVALSGAAGPEGGAVAVEGLDGPVDIYRDSYGVPHIYAKTPEDLFFAQGYVEAQDRFWQMEFQRRVGRGELSEILGDTTLGTDIFLRTMGFRDLAEEDFEQLNDEAKTVLEAYAAGVNAYIFDKAPAELGLEFSLLEIQGVDWDIRPWEPTDSLIWARMMIFDQSDKLATELRNVARIRAVGIDRAEDFLPPFRAGRPTIVPDEELDYLNLEARTFPPYDAAFTDAELEQIAALGTQALEIYDRAALDVYGAGVTGASNSWVIGPELSATGDVLLANDPHMSKQIPSLWYEVGLHCVEKSDDCIYELRGFSLVGIPGLLIGHNDRIAWGLTNASYDVEDVYIERINPENPNQYEVNGEWVDMEITREEIKVAGWTEPHILFVRYTRHGPVASDNMTEEDGFNFTADGPELLALSYRWTAFEPLGSMQAVLDLNRAQNYEDFRAALSRFDAGKQNFVYGDVDGNIGYQMGGLIPIRAAGDGSLPVPGWNDDYEWTGYIPYDDLPRAYNPAQGYIAAANAAAVGDDYPYWLGREVDRGYRIERIVNLIESDGDGIDIDDMRRWQTDNLSLPALEMLPYLEALEFNNMDHVAARDWLLEWDGQMHMDSPHAALYNLFWVDLIGDVYHDDLPEDLWPRGAASTQEMMFNLLPNSDGLWWDNRGTPWQEDRDDMLSRAFASGYEAGVERFGEDLNTWRWGDLHTSEFVHNPLGQSGIAALENLFNRGPVATGGSETVINKTGWTANDPYVVTSIPALRQIVDLGDLTNSLMIHSTGQSGHPGHPHYDDFIDPWRLFEYHPSHWDRADVEADADDHLVLEPPE